MALLAILFLVVAILYSSIGLGGGPYGVGNRIDLHITRRILHHCINDSFDDKSFAISEVLDLVFPKYISSNKKINLDPSDKWHDKEKYMSAAKKLNQLFNNNISAYN